MLKMAPLHHFCVFFVAFVIQDPVSTTADDKCLCPFNEHNCSRLIENDAIYYVTFKVLSTNIRNDNIYFEPNQIIASGLLRCWNSTFQPVVLEIKKCRRGDPIYFEDKPSALTVYYDDDKAVSGVVVCVVREKAKSVNLSSSEVIKLVTTKLQFPKLWMISVTNVRVNFNQRVLHSLTSVSYLHLSRVHLDQIPSKILENARQLYHAKFSYNDIREIRSESFINQKKLAGLCLSYNKLECLGICTPNETDNFTKYLEKLFLLRISHNRISKICPNFFDDTLKLQKLYLDNNEISTLSGVFGSDRNSITDLNLSHNRLEYISNTDFIFLTRLNILDLSHNHVKFIEEFAFQTIINEYFQILNLDNNFLQSTDFLERMNDGYWKILLRNNNIQQFPTFVNFFKDRRNSTCDLSGNHISHLTFSDLASVNCDVLNLENNTIKTFDFQGISVLRDKSITVNINDNPLTCDCSAKPLLKHVTSGNSMLKISIDNAYCHQPKSLRNILFTTVDASFLHCEEERNCPLNCTCQYSSFETTVDCNNGNLKNIPIVIPRNATSLHMDYNTLTSLKNLHKWNSLQSLNIERCLTLGTVEASDITELNGLKNLTMLSLQHNNLTTLPEFVFENLTNLSVLMLGYNKLFSLSTKITSSLYRLTQLLINNNELETLSDLIFENNSELQIIKACCNQFSSIKMNISKLNNLRHVDLSNNRLTSIDIQWPTNITDILLSGNLIKSLKLENFPKNLHILDLHSNRLDNLNMTELYHFDHSNSLIDFSNNSILHISLSGVNFDKSLTCKNFFESVIVLNNNPIHCDCHIRSFLEYARTRNEEMKLFLFKMNRLYCNSPEFMKNKLVENLNVSQLPCEQNQCVPECKCYNQSSCEYRIMECESYPKIYFGDSGDIVNEVHIKNGGSVNLTHFTSSYWDSLNLITIQALLATKVTTAIFSRMTNLTSVTMTNNVKLQFSENVFSHLPQLITLDLHSSGLTTLKNNSFRDDIKLQFLDLSYNFLTTMPDTIFIDLYSLQSLDLSNNSFTDLKTEWFKNLTNLKKLCLKHNYVRVLQNDILRNCEVSEVLDLSENLITTFQSVFLPFGIIRVDFSKNQLKTVENSWINLRHVKTFDLSFNFINDANMSLLMEFPSFTTIKLQNNNISKVIWSADKNFSNNLNVNLGNNPFTCDCNLKQFVRMINEQYSGQLRSETSENLFCSQPVEFADVSLTSLANANLYCEIEICPDGCDCRHYSNGEINIFNCVATIGTDLRTCPDVVDELYLSGNASVQYLQKECWKFLKKLHIAKNFFVKNISSELLKNYGELVELSLRSNGISEIPSKLFQFSRELHIVDLRDNLLQNLPPELFKNLLKLQQIDASGNQLKVVHWQIPLSLQSLNLAENRIEEIEIPKLSSHYELKMLNISRNRLKDVPNIPYYLYHLKNLQILDLSYNEISIECSNQLSIFPKSLQSLNLSHNKLNCTHFWSELYKPSARLRNFDLSRNPIETLRVSDFVYSNNSELVVDMRNCSLKYYSLNYTHVNDETWNVFLSIDISQNEFIVCDCNIRRYNELARTQNNNLTLYLKLISMDTCDLTHLDLNVDSLSKFDGIRNDNFCAVVDNCSTHCICLKSNVTMLMFCVGKNFVSLPTMSPVNVQYLNLDYNNLTVVEGLNRPNWKDLVTISVRHNRVKSLSNEDLFLLEYLQFVFLDGNQLLSPSGWLEDFVNENILPFNVTLSDNPWLCTCANDLFKKWVNRFTIERKILDGDHIFCSDGNLFVNVDLCPVDTLEILLPALAVCIILLSMLTLTIVYYRKKMVIHAWCYSKNLCGCCVNEDDIDEDKVYDGFLSYCEEDAGYVSRQLLPGLEEQQPFFKICIHHRDWAAGVPIVEQIESSIKNSRRVIFVMSRNFANSPWANLEFRIANMQSIEDKINRVITITLDQDFLTDDLDPEFRAYLTMTTYLKADDAQFWNKLRYVMPHKGKIRKNLRHKTVSALQLVEIAEDAV